ncbi:MAG: hypothetical protein J0M08_08405, partial [Bacteroidetes bacterium]|nr:hypothetical protein [Bacteroidota bacterium]
MIYKRINIAFFVAATVFLISCTGNKKVDESTALVSDSLLSVGNDSTKNLSQKSMDEIITSIPSPVEITSLIKQSGSDYNNLLLNPSSNASLYNTNGKKALAIGLYGADLGYINIYEKTYSALDYLNVVRDLADEIKVGQFFDFNTLKRLAQSKKNTDSLLLISTNCFNNMDSYLREQKRSNMSVLMACGAWLEGTYLITQVAGERVDENLNQRIGEQKAILYDLLIVLDACKEDPACISVKNDFEKIKKEFTGVAISYEFKEPETKEVNGELVVVDNSKTN